MPDIMGKPISAFEDPIRDALSRYATDSDGSVSFDLDRACNLDATPGKPNAARSYSDLIYKGEQVGSLALVIIAFQPGDATGDISEQYRIDNVDFGPYPKDKKVIARSKALIHTEGHLTITAINADDATADFVQFAGSLDLIGATGPNQDSRYRLGRVTTLGYDAGINQAMVWGLTDASPRATATTGYYNPKKPGYLDSRADQAMRFGDPHAVFNSTQDIQVAAFLGLKPEVAAQHFDVLAALGVKAPWQPKQH